MRSGRLLRAGASAFVIGWMSVAAAQTASVGSTSPVASHLEAFQVTRDAAGKEQFAPAGQVKPGDVIEYRLGYDNTGSQPVSQLAVNGPVPQGTAFIAGSAQTAVKSELRFSVDGGKTWASPPLKRSVRTAEGVSVEQIVAPQEYTNVQWLAREPLRAGGHQDYRYRVSVVSAQP